MELTKVTNKVPKTVRPHTAPRDTVALLQARAEKSQVFSAMCHIFALRERTRQQITVNSLYHTMIKEGFKFTKKQYADELQFMASIGIGKIELTPRKAVRVLKDIRVTLQSIGLAGISKSNALKQTTINPLFQNLPITEQIIERPVESSASIKLPAVKRSPPVPLADDFKATLTVMIEGKNMTFDLSKLSTKDLLSIMAKAKAGA